MINLMGKASHISMDPLGPYSPSRIFIEYTPKPVYWEFFHIYDVQITRK